MNDPAFEKFLEKMTERFVNGGDKDEKISIEGLKKENDKETISFLPTELCRTSLFFPIEKKALQSGKRVVEKRVIIETAWGKLIAIGPTLTVYDEDVLLATLHTIKENLPKNSEYYRYKGKMSTILKALNLSDGKENYDRIKDSLTMMSVMAFEFIRFNEEGKKKSTTVVAMPIVQKAYWEEDDRELDVIINPYFYQMYEKKDITLINLDYRAKIKSQIGKALYRFLQSHKDEWTGKISTLATTLNINPELPNKKIKERIKDAINELKKLKLISVKSSIIEGNLVTLKKLKKPLKNKKKI